MRRKITHAILLTGILLGAAGCGSKPELEGRDLAAAYLEAENGQEYVQEQESGAAEEGWKAGAEEEAEEPESVPARLGFEEAKEMLSEYGSSLEELKAQEIYIVAHGQESGGREYWDAFYESAGNGEAAELILAQFTTDGDPILSYVHYDGSDFYVVADRSRDKWLRDGEKYHEITFPCLYVLEHKEEDGGVKEYVVLSDREELDWDWYVFGKSPHSSPCITDENREEMEKMWLYSVYDLLVRSKQA